MAEVKAPTRADAIALLARRLRRQYGERLQDLFILRNDPYEPDEAFSINIVAVFADEAYDFDEALTEVVRVAQESDAAMDYAFATTVRPLSRSAFDHGETMSARAARAEGVRL